MKKTSVALLLSLLVTAMASGAVFIVPDDSELTRKSNVIVAGRVASAETQVTSDGIETVYRVHVDRTFKGAASGTIEVVSSGGLLNGEFTIVRGAAHFNKGDEVLLFLVPYRGRWTTTDMTLGKFRAVTSTGGQRLLVRDEEDIVGFDRDQRPHVERVRKHDEFLRFIADVVRGGSPAAIQMYFVDPRETLAIERENGPKQFNAEANASYAASTYAMQFQSGAVLYPVRWPSTRMSASLARPFSKSSAQNASALGDGGVAQITSALSAWTLDCPSAVNFTYGDPSTSLKNRSDGVNVVVYNDPGNHIANSWTGSGVIATAFVSGEVGAFHSFDGGTWVSLLDADIVVQNGITGAEAFMSTALMHEIGHAIGLRHSNTRHDEAACTTAEECTSTAIMSSRLDAMYASPQPWDLAAIRKIYPHTCSTASVRYDHNGDGNADIFWRNTANGLNFMYQMNGNVHTPFSVQAESDLNWKIVGIADFDGDARSDVLWRNDATGQNWMYLMNGAAVTSLPVNYEANLTWKVAAVGDFNGDGKGDIYWRNSSTGQNWIYMMSGNVITASLSTRNEVDMNWQIVAVGDFNGDGKDDLYWRNSATGVNFIYQMDGATATGMGTQYETNLSWKVVGAGDFNADGRDDILWRNDATGQNWMYQMNGASVTSLPVNYETNLNWKVANVADFNGDGKADILWRNWVTGQNWMYQMNGNIIAGNLPVQAESNLDWKIQK